MSKVLLLNGSPHKNGCTAAALTEMIAVFDSLGVEHELIQVGAAVVRGCVGCGFCRKNVYRRLRRRIPSLRIHG